LLDLNELIPGPWQEPLIDCRDEIFQISKKLDELHGQGIQILPRWDQIFAALALPPHEVKVVLLGQDPYPKASLPIGRSFAVAEGTTPLPGSLRNIFKERAADVGGKAPSPTLAEWSNQGVLLLNRILTVNAGESASHDHLGWQSVTTRVTEISAELGAIGILWGRSAQEVAGFFKDRLVTGAHPSPLSAHRGFFASRPFSAANRLLDRPISW
jgi:uracil-DNA glycosylase